MMGRNHVALAALALGVFAASSANAQATSSAGAGVQFGVSAGLAAPTGDLADGAKSGYNVNGHLGFSPAAIPFGLRVDVGYTHMGLEEGVDGSVSAINGTLNALFKIPMSGSVTPYVLAGPGVYNVKAKVDDLDIDESTTGFGFDAGAGLQFNLSGMTTNLEAAYVSAFTDKDKFGMDKANMFRVTFGMMFGH